jgi:SEC-C motif-containing protein
MNKKICFCGSTDLFSDCCQPLLSGQSHAQTAKQLMRSRYSAFCTANIDYLLNTQHPSRSAPEDRELLTETIASCQWVNLSIKQSLKGQENDDTGEVEFIASYLQQSQLQQLHEHSYFIKENGHWFYTEGDIISVSPPAL